MCHAGQAQARAVPVTMNEMLLRGCTLKNTGHILGLAVYTGNETRIQKNSAKTPNKIGKPPVHAATIEMDLDCTVFAADTHLCQLMQAVNHA